MEDKNDLSIPMEWVDRIFERMADIYKERWTEWQGSERNKTYTKTMWRSGLYGLTAQEIKYGLMVCRSSPTNSTPPHVIEFYHYAKKIRKPIHRDYIPDVKGNPEIAKAALAQIKNKLIEKRST